MEEETDDSLRDDTAVVDEEDCMEEALAAVMDVDADEDCCCTAVVADFEAAAIMDEDSVLLFMEAETTDCFWLLLLSHLFKGILILAYVISETYFLNCASNRVNMDLPLISDGFFYLN